MKQLYVHPKADSDIDNQFEHIAEHNLDAAVRFYHATYQTFNSLTKTPYIGTARQFSNVELEGLRMWFVQGFQEYLIFYRVLDDVIEIVRVLHGARDIEAVLNEDE